MAMMTFLTSLRPSLPPYNAPLTPSNIPRVLVDTKQAADIERLIQWANRNNATIVPLGGNTNLVRACDIEFTASNQASLIIYLRYTHRQLDYDPATKQITCSPNITMAELHDYCDSIHRRWDVHFSALSATIGGIMSTNAGGEQSKASKHLVALNIIDGLGKPTIKSRCASNP